MDTTSDGSLIFVLDIWEMCSRAGGAQQADKKKGRKGERAIEIVMVAVIVKAACLSVHKRSHALLAHTHTPFLLSKPSISTNAP